MSEVVIGKGDLAGKGIYAARNFKKGEIVIQYNLKPLTFVGYKALPKSEQMFTHTEHGQIYLYSEPERYVNNSNNPNVYNDLERKADVALRDINKGEAITVKAVDDDVPILKKVDAVLVKVPSLEEGLDFYRIQLGQVTLWMKEDMAAVKLGDAELVLSTKFDPETDILVESVPEAVEIFTKAGGSVEVEPEDIDVGKVAIVKDPFGNRLTLVDLSKGVYQTDDNSNITGIG